MFQRPRNISCKIDDIMNLKVKNNEAIGNVAIKFNHLVLSIRQMDEETQFFDQIGNLSAMGKTEIWKQINSDIRDFEKKKISLKPRRRLPTPLYMYFTSIYGNTSRFLAYKLLFNIVSLFHV